MIMRIGFIPVPGFNMMSLSAAIEPLRIANRMRNERLFEWTTLWCERRAEASNGLAIEPERGFAEIQDLDVLFVCASFNAAGARSSGAVECLRRFARSGRALGAIGTGTYLLAWAGLLGGRRCTIHWEHLPAFAEAFTRLDVTENLYEIDRKRYTTGGGTAVLDMMLHLIGEWTDRRLSLEVSTQVLYRNVRPPDDHQRSAESLSTTLFSPSLRSACALMRENTLDPLTIPAIAEAVGLSQRQLERLFKAHYCCSPLDYYLRLRLEQARNLLLESTLPVGEVARAVGFGGSSHFARRYAERFGATPSAERRRARVDQA